MVLLRRSFCWALKWTHRVVCVHSKDLVRDTGVLQFLLLARSVPSRVVDGVCVHACVLYSHCAAVKCLPAFVKLHD